MSFLKSFLLSMCALLIAFPLMVMATIDAPIAAEYWVSEMITVKRELAKAHAGQKKIVLVGGSSTLFGFDAARASAELGLPVVNLGLHAAMSLTRILDEASGVVEKGDSVVLVFEPPYYECGSRFTSWQVRNGVAWDHDMWRSLSGIEKVEFAYAVSPSMLGSMVLAKVQSSYFPNVVAARKHSLDRDGVLAKYRAAQRSASFEYSVTNLDASGSFQGPEVVAYAGKAVDGSKPGHACKAVLGQLRDFGARMTQRGVKVYFANTPYLVSQPDLPVAKNAEALFVADVSAVGCVIDRRADLLMPRQYFYDTPLHLNAMGQRVRTDLFVRDWRRVESAGSCAT